MQQKNAEKIKELFTKSTRSDTMQTKENVFLCLAHINPKSKER